MTEKPNPGSAEAVDLGCTCPIIDNHYGKGIPMNGKRFHYMNDDCPLHGEPAIAKAIYTNRSELYANNLLPHSEDDA